MNILFLTLIDFYSLNENNIYTDLMREFVKNGHSLSVISPVEKKHNKKTTMLSYERVNIFKPRIGNIQKTNIIEKGISTLTLEYVFINAIKKHFSTIKFDLIIYSTPPITFEKAINYVKNRDNAKTYLLLKDIFPQNALDIGLLKKTGPKALVFNYFKKKEEKLYAISDFIGCMSSENANYILKHSKTARNKIVEVCPNSVEPSFNFLSLEQKTEIRKKYKLPLDKFIFIYGGNLGKPQGVDFILKCLKENELNPRSFFLIVGSGTESGKINDFVVKYKPKNCRFIDFLNKTEFDVLLRSCDVGLVFLDNRFNIPNYPSRILSYMDAGLSVLASTDLNTDIKDDIEKGNFGFWCESYDVKEFNFLVNKMCNKPLLNELGQNSRMFLEENFTTKISYSIIIDHFKV